MDCRTSLWGLWCWQAFKTSVSICSVADYLGTGTYKIQHGRLRFHVLTDVQPGWFRRQRSLRARLSVKVLFLIFPSLLLLLSNIARIAVASDQAIHLNTGLKNVFDR